MLIMQMDPFFWGVVGFCLVMFALMLLAIFQSLSKNKKATYEVEAVIVESEMRRGYRGVRSYRPVYEYKYMGNKYRVSSDTKIYASEHKVIIGKKVMLNIDPNRPDYIKEPLAIKDVFNNPLIGIYIVGFIIVVFVLYGKVIKMLLGWD